ncbi:pseudouridine synthase [Leeia oryzae]|uniref:pseudouridine synthase n=1 Tax=Leeia oryzae TaxID=356662 RepID=UPI000374FF2B|nr:pseudouridine synthase [Leeia oryzae]
MKPVALSRILQSQGFGSRKDCERLIRSGRVTANGEPVQQPARAYDPAGLVFTVDDAQHVYHEFVYVMLNKPAGYECSHDPQHHASVFGLLPAHLIARGIQCVGRLDQDTTGLLLLTDDGTFNHAMTHPRKHVAKTYLVTVKHPFSDEMRARLLDGVLLHGEDAIVKALRVERLGDLQLLLTIAEGKYHQVKRMLAAVGNRVEALHREAFGAVNLGDLPEGQWQLMPDLPEQM